MSEESTTNNPSVTDTNKQYKCHKCSTIISIDSSQIPKNKLTIEQQNNENNNIISDICESKITLQCVYVNCSYRTKNLYLCTNCSEISQCRNCRMPLCKLCRINLKVLACKYCNSYICSQQCYGSLLKKYFECLENRYGIAVNAHQSMHFFRKLLLPPHLHSNLSNIKDDDLPFHVCDNCKAQNCGCIDWLSCVNCRKYYCIDCEDKVFQKCGLEQCECRTCCHKEEWNKKCEYCNRFGNCGLIFCTKGHCDRHIIINKEIGFDKEEKNNDKNNDECKDDNKIDNKIDNNENININENDNDGDIDLTT